MRETSAPARVDEIKATQVGASGGKFLAVKAVCQNFTALPVLYSPVNQGSWAPPYQVTPKSIARSPLFLADQTCGSKGFEEPTLFEPPDGLLHVIGHDHGHCAGGNKYAHFISANKSLGHWLEAPGFGDPKTSGAFSEPNPIPVAGDGVFGKVCWESDKGGVDRLWSAFGRGRWPEFQPRPLAMEQRDGSSGDGTTRAVALIKISLWRRVVDQQNLLKYEDGW